MSGGGGGRCSSRGIDLPAGGGMGGSPNWSATGPMQTVVSNASSQGAPASPSLYTPTGDTPSLRQVCAMRTATSPRLATIRRLKGARMRARL